MKNLKTFEGYTSENLNFVVIFDQVEKEFDLIPSGYGMIKNFNTIETIKDVLKRRGISKNIIDIIKDHSTIESAMKELKEPLNSIGFNIILFNIEELKNVAIPIYLISIPSGEIINILSSSIPYFLDKKLITYDRKIGKYVCEDRNSITIKKCVPYY